MTSSPGWTMQGSEEEEEGSSAVVSPPQKKKMVSRCRTLCERQTLQHDESLSPHVTGSAAGGHLECV